MYVLHVYGVRAKMYVDILNFAHLFIHLSIGTVNQDR